jgi:hypothetical protein
MHRVTVEAEVPDSTTRITTGFVICSHCDRLGVKPLTCHVPLLNCKHIIWISCHMVGRRKKSTEFHAPKIVDPRTPLDQEVTGLPWSAKPQLQFGQLTRGAPPSTHCDPHDPACRGHVSKKCERILHAAHIAIKTLKRLERTNPSVRIDRMDDYQAIYHKTSDLFSRYPLSISKA